MPACLRGDPRVCLALAALAALTLLRLAMAAAVPLVPDEAYYWVWSRALAPGYPDHPPMVALWIGLGTALAGDGPLGIRLLGPLSVAAASLLLADAAARLVPGRNAGLHAATLLNATLLLGVGSVLMTPDAPLLVFWTASLWALARLLHSGDGCWWLAAGLFAGLAMTSKYTAALLWFGIAIWLVVTPALRPWLRRSEPYLGALLAIVIFLPVVLWEAAHGWPSFARQGGRIGTWQPANAVRFLAELIGGQIGLATPLVFAFCAGGIVLAARQAWHTREPRWTLLAALTLPAVALFIQHATGDRVQGNWPAIVYPAAAIAAGGLITPIWNRLRIPALALGFGITALVYVQAVLAPLPLPASRDPISLQLAGWDTLAAEVDAVRRQQGAGFVASDQYGVAAKLARLLPRSVAVVAVDPRWEQTRLLPAAVAGKTGILIRSAQRGADQLPWPDAIEIGQAERRRGDETVQTFWLYRVIPPHDETQAVMLPRL